MDNEQPDEMSGVENDREDQLEFIRKALEIDLENLRRRNARVAARGKGNPLAADAIRTVKVD